LRYWRLAMRFLMSLAALLFAAVALFGTGDALRNPNYPVTKLPHGNVTVLATAHTKRFIHAFATGADLSLYHKYVDLQASPDATKWTDWIVRSTAVNGTWEGDPCVGVNADGTVEVFIRYSTGLDLWQLYQTDPEDPNSFTDARECTCPTAPNCPQPWDDYFWNTQPVFPTSDCQVVTDPSDGRLQIYVRGFTGEYYRVRQRSPGDHHYLPPENFGQLSLME